MEHTQQINPDKYNDILIEIQEIENSGFSIREKYLHLKYILDRVCKDITQNDPLQFSSLFSRIVYIAQKYNLLNHIVRHIQEVRIKSNFLLKDEKNSISELQYIVAKDYIIHFISIIYLGDRVGEDLSEKQLDNKKISSPPNKLRIQVTDINKEEKLIYGISDSQPDDLITIRYGVKDVNEFFNPTVEKLWLNAQLNIINPYTERETGYLVPHYIVLEPDYLIDVSSIAECFQNYGDSHLHYFRRKFEPASNSKHILLGNLANFFLDELIYSEDPARLDFNDIFLQAFRNSPFEFTSCNEIKNNADFREFMVKARTQFENIRRVITKDFIASNIEPEKCILEPSFFCEKFGFQGRLDLLQLSLEDKIKIIELKSGGLPFPKDNPGKISPNHEAQTIIYRLMIESVFEKKSQDILPAILYSVSENRGENLRFSAPYKELEKRIINLRNLIVVLEHQLYTGDTESVADIFSEVFDLKNYGKTPQFFIEKLESLEKIIKNVTETERKYFYRFINFISRELYIQKVGNEGYETFSGVSSLWTSGFKERENNFELISGLEIINIDESGNDMKILFRMNKENSFSNFREGEICILYPKEKEEDTVLSNQILKGTIAYIKDEQILVRFRYKQKNKYYLKSHNKWVIEHDRLDYTYNAMFRGLFHFLTAPVDKRNILLGLEAPKTIGIQQLTGNDQINSIENKQKQIIEKVLVAEDYFLLLGPPGTGKTSVYAKKLIEDIYSNSDAAILIIAYTNKAVDELCQVIESIGDNKNYIRIGSELSCNEIYRQNLLQNISKNIQTREQLRTFIQKNRIFVGTLASIAGKPELFDIKKFDIAIIDEASQILEPQIIGLLPNFNKFIMIGDHKQLSTITQQSVSKSKVTDTELTKIGLTDCRESYFERMYRICCENGWKHAYDTLEYQGRMHKEIADFPNKYFYDNRLKHIYEWQTEPLILKSPDNADIFQKTIINNRIGFIPVKTTAETSLNNKVNHQEADIAVYLTKAIIEIYNHNNLFFDENKTLGIIAPYRNQIALIKQKLQSTGIPQLKNIMVDSVERFQGSQKDIIIFSFCMNKPYQLDFFCNLTADSKTDRKLNVALTRARQQLFLIGNKDILYYNKIYQELISTIKTIEI